MTIKEEILTIANQLANQGQKPSVALIKTKLSQNVALPTIISVLKSWQHDPNFTQVKQTTTPAVQKIDEIDTTKQLIEQAIAPLKVEIETLKQQVKQLLAQKN